MVIRAGSFFRPSFGTYSSWAERSWSHVTLYGSAAVPLPRRTYLSSTIRDPSSRTVTLGPADSAGPLGAAALSATFGAAGAAGGGRRRGRRPLRAAGGAARGGGRRADQLGLGWA